MSDAPTTNGVPAGTSNKSRGQLKRLKAKKKAALGASNGVETIPEVPRAESVVPKEEEVEDEKVEYVVEEVNADFKDVFARFQLPSADDLDEDGKPLDPSGKGEIIYSDDEMPSESEDGDKEEEVEVSKRKLRKMNRLSVAELKRLVKKPEVVDWVDVSATDPKLLVQLKSYRNTVPIPPHWSQKRDYLQGKRGIEKAQFQLPSFIADTGIATQRDAIKEKEEGQSLKAKTRERVQPKMGKIDIDYQKLHDAFFKFQTKPKMTEFGELYYEGKEFETKLKEKKPGDLSDELKEALSIPPLAPPPWLISMQRYGPPPSYPNLRIGGLNAPIPEGAAWGFHPGGWGKPALDEYGRPLYGDVYGVNQKYDETESGLPIEKDPWGELEPDEEESEEEEDSDDEDEGPTPGGGLETPSGLDTPSGLSSVTSTVPGGLETPDFLDLRKRREATEDDTPKSLYQVIPERESRMRGLMGSDRVYDVSGVVGSAPPVPVLGKEERGTKRKAGGVDIALDASDLEGLSEADLKARYEAQTRNRGTHEDFSGDVEQEMKKRRVAEAKRREKGGGREKDSFKF
ncbi:splicing factor 3B subunit 2, partial [Phenoliferia sp. Uapishka_3]